MYEKLFEAGQIGGLKLKNRLVMTPVGVGLANLDGTPSDEMIAYYEARAAGGAGLILPEICRVDDVTGPGLLRQISATRDRNVPALARLAAAIHRHGAKTMIQLHHPGRETYSSLLGGAPVVGASAIPCKRCKQETRALTTDEVRHIIREFVDAAARVQQAGFDGIELHCAHGYLLEQFLSPYTNKREDEYGGSFENRMRMVLEIISGIRERCGEDFPLGCRLSVEEFLSATGVTEDYIHIQDGVRIAQELQKAGIDFIDVSCGIYETGITSVEPVSYAEGWRHDLIAAVRKNVSIPVIAVSNFRGPDVPESFLEEGLIDFAGMGRAWLADPEWGRKVQEGRVDELRKCISCLRCFESLEQNAEAAMPLECAVNPTCAAELRCGSLEPDVEHHHLVVVGAGPAGMCAAETAATRGCRVTLLEAARELGGDVVLAAAPPLKEKMSFVPEYYAKVLPDLGVDIHLGERATVESVLALEPDAVILATGGSPIVPRSIPGLDGPNVACVPEVLTGRRELADKSVVVVGAGMTGIETAEYAAEKGAAHVVVVDMLDSVAPGVNPVNVLDVMGRLRKYGVEFRLGQKLVSADAQGLALESTANGSASRLDCDLVVLSLGNRPNTELREGLEAADVEVRVVGSAVKDGNISPATHGGYAAARELFLPHRPQASFHALDEDVAKFGQPSIMGDQRGIYIAFTTTPEAIRRVLPPELTPFKMPVVVLSINHINRPSFTDDYYEAILGVYCYAGEQLGQYTLSLLLGGNGQEMATQLGRDNGSMPKKMGAEFVLRRDGDVVTAEVSRRGCQVASVRMELGEYNTPLTHMIFQGPGAGVTTKGCGFYYHFDRMVRPEGGAELTSGALLGALVQYDYKEWTPGYVTKLELRSTPDDPWGELPVISVIGGGLSTLDLTVCGMRRLADVDAKAILPYLLSAWYDRSALGECGRI